MVCVLMKSSLLVGDIDCGDFLCEERKRMVSCFYLPESKLNFAFTLPAFVVHSTLTENYFPDTGIIGAHQFLGLLMLFHCGQ